MPKTTAKCHPKIISAPSIHTCHAMLAVSMHALINKASTKLSQLTSATEGQIVAVWVTALAVQRGGDRGGGGRGNVLRRGAGGQKVMIMISEGGWHRHVGRFRWYLHRGIDGGTNAVCARFLRRQRSHLINLANPTTARRSIIVRLVLTLQHGLIADRLT